MPRVLILFGTTDGQTAKIARFVAEECRSQSLLADVVDVAVESVEPSGYDAVVVAASIHVGGYQRAVVDWVHGHAAELRTMPNAFLSVCLGILQKDPKVRRDLDAIRQRFVARTGWEPARFVPVAGALRYTRYGWMTRLIMRRIAARAGESTDTSRDHEYTDWAGLRTFAWEFAAELRTRAPIAEARASLA